MSASPFSSLGLSEPIVRAVTELGYSSPTRVQVEAIAAVMRGGDVVVSAPTGSGKTAAFVLPILQRLSAEGRSTPRSVRALIVVPTRELAAQIGDAITTLGQHLPERLKCVVVFGGVSINPQMMALRGGADLVVATPGRLLDLVAHNALRLSEVTTLILDEADRLYSLGFADELGHVLALLPERRQSLLFSATLPPAVLTLAERMLVAPVRVQIVGDEGTDASEPNTIVERAIEVDPARRTQLLVHLVRERASSQLLVFVATTYGADHVASKLVRAGIRATSLHGELSQGARRDALAAFKAKRIQVLIATDLAARGIDIASLDCVVNYDLPRSVVEYVHRIGRTGRAGEAGVAISFVSAETAAHFRLIEKRHRVQVPRERLVGFAPEAREVPVVAAGGGVKGKRTSKKDKLRAAAARAGDQVASANPPIADERFRGPSR
ncbi:MAG: DEAD/DEAH box helicase [Polyangiales bacterium]